MELALRGIARTVAHVERDAYAAATLVARMEAQELDQAPVWSDLCTFDAAAWRGRVALVTAGFPCQPFSSAGRKLGIDDDRWLWPEIARIIRDMEPDYVFLENVPGVVRAGLAHVLGDLADLGFDAEWGLLAASAVGAPHRRERFWLVAHRQGAGWHQWLDGAQSCGLPADTQAEGQPVADSMRGNRQQDSDSITGSPCSRVCRNADGCDADVADADSPGCPRLCQRTRQELPKPVGHRFPPRPDDHDGWQRWEGAQPSIRRGADGATEWLADALHLGGNGLVPQCAREAWQQLTDRLGGVR